MKRFFSILLIVLVFIGLGGFAYYQNNLRPVSSDTKTKVFTIKTGDGIDTISTNLIKNNLIRDKYSFIVYAYLSGLNSKLKSGNFKLSPSLNAKEIAQKLTQDGSHDYWLKIVDGTRVEEVAALFPDNLKFSSKDFITKAKSLEGYLYPDSYLVPEYFNIDQILAQIDTNFTQKFSQAKADATNIKFTDQQIVVFASLLEREGKTLESKQKIAGILLNRINIGMPLQLDATIQYARDSKTANLTDYWQPLDSRQIDTIISPYNTYKNKGLPPKPICNPGYNSIYAAFHPIDSDYMYYLTGSDGIMHYAKTLDEHNLNIQKYLR